MKSALILIDIQKDYFRDGYMELFGMDWAAQNAGQLLKYYRENHLPVFHIQHVTKGEPNAAPFVEGTPGAEIDDSVKPLEGESIISKYYPNSFRETNLLHELKKIEVGELVICGAMTHMCVDSTTRAAADLGFQCVVIHDACATKDLVFRNHLIPAREVHCTILSALEVAYAQVLSLQEFLAQKTIPSG
ncbi:cysteine hydrolase family protein [Crocosphaera sp.]|uniref:cysteine hydrolase family protein n=1 Tax=Crocosphaera sp. TaxID=2729996 RepID=UPI00262519DF|nr:cysteine hydrolase family protein [Crocosphaera sp.]MDJ0583345.1 cysteine hydrolase family protein [Crocosphaera sp.]